MKIASPSDEVSIERSENRAFDRALVGGASYFGLEVRTGCATLGLFLQPQIVYTLKLLCPKDISCLHGTNRSSKDPKITYSFLSITQNLSHANKTCQPEIPNPGTHVISGVFIYMQTSKCHGHEKYR